MSVSDNSNKTKIYLPEDTYAVLCHDTEQFEIWKGKDREPNLNGLMNKLISGYFDRYREEMNRKAISVKKIAASFKLSAKDQETLTDQIMQSVIIPETPKKKGKKANTLTLTFSSETQHLQGTIQEEAGIRDSLSGYICHMFMSYCEKPIYERERIIFHDTAEFLKKAAEKNREIVFTTTSNPKYAHHVIPYELVWGQEEMNNYLLGQEFNKESNRAEPVSVRLCRINRPSYSLNSDSLQPDTIHKLELMKKYGPQFVISEEMEACVRLTKDGQNTFRMIYQNRPKGFIKGEPNENDEREYLFYCSLDQLYRYFRRFNAGQAEVIYPIRLRERIKKFYRDSLKMYEED